jgi:hypothetical protein
MATTPRKPSKPGKAAKPGTETEPARRTFQFPHRDASGRAVSLLELTAVALIGVLVLVGCVVAWYSPFAFTLGRTTAPAGPVRDDMAISEISLTGTDSAS